MKFALTLAFVTLLCTCARAQNSISRLPKEDTNIAFIKGETGFLIDSITIRTTLDTMHYGFAFPNDTLFLDISVFSFADELTIETFAAGHSFGQSRCWVDAPTADVHLSVNSGRNVIDSVGLSPIDRIYRQEIAKIQLLKDPSSIKVALKATANNYTELLMVVDFLTALADMPNLNRKDINDFSSILDYVGTSKQHPRYKNLLMKHKLMSSALPGKLSKYDLNDPDGQPVEIERPKDQFYVINFYDSSLPASRRDHELLAQSLAIDSIFTGLPIISISKERALPSWQRYVQDGAFSWPHYHESEAAKRKLSTRMQLYPTNTYVLVNKRNLIEGVYDDVIKLANAVVWRRNIGELNKP